MFSIYERLSSSRTAPTPELVTARTGVARSGVPQPEALGTRELLAGGRGCRFSAGRTRARQRPFARPLLPQEKQASGTVKVVLSLLVRSDHLAGIDHGDCIHTVAEVTARPWRTAADCCFRRLCLQANGGQLAIRSALVPTPRRERGQRGVEARTVGKAGVRR